MWVNKQNTNQAGKNWGEQKKECIVCKEQGRKYNNHTFKECGFNKRSWRDKTESEDKRESGVKIAHNIKLEDMLNEEKNLKN